MHSENNSVTACLLNQEEPKLPNLGKDRHTTQPTQQGKLA